MIKARLHKEKRKPLKTQKCQQVICNFTTKQIFKKEYSMTSITHNMAKSMSTAMLDSWYIKMALIVIYFRHMDQTITCT